MEQIVVGARALAPDAVSVEALSDHVLRVRFSDGQLRLFDMKPLLARKCYQALCSDAVFRTARVELGVIVWANGCDLDPDWLYADSVPDEDERCEDTGGGSLWGRA